MFVPSMQTVIFHSLKTKVSSPSTNGTTRMEARGSVARFPRLKRNCTFAGKIFGRLHREEARKHPAPSPAALAS